MRLVVAPKENDHRDSETVPSLLKAIARGHQWAEWIKTGEVSNQRSIALRLGLNERYVARVLECSYLAPDIIEAVLDGRQSADISFQKLTRRLPISWNAQKQILGQPTQIFTRFQSKHLARASTSARFARAETGDTK
jgi:hypothetical protein